jgi:histidine triad (HIT) family protein
MAAPQCIFCEIVAGRAPADIVYQDELTLAVIDLRQHNPGHVLVIPKAHINDIRGMDEQTGSAVMSTLTRIARAVDRAFAGEGMTVWHSIGPAAFQEVPHMHLHVHPRHMGDGLLRVYPGVPTDAAPAVRAEYGERVRRALEEEGSDSRKSRSE